MTAEIYEDHVGQHRWRIVAANGRIMADSGEGYASRSNARRALERLAAAFMYGEIVDDELVLR